MKTLFTDAVGTPPPSRVNVDRLIARRKRIWRARRIGLTALAVLAVGAIGVVVDRPSGGPATVATPDPSASAARDRDARSDRLAAAVLAVVGEVTSIHQVRVGGPGLSHEEAASG